MSLERNTKRNESMPIKADSLLGRSIAEIASSGIFGNIIIDEYGYEKGLRIVTTNVVFSNKTEMSYRDQEQTHSDLSDGVREIRNHILWERGEDFINILSFHPVKDQATSGIIEFVEPIENGTLRIVKIHLCYDKNAEAYTASYIRSDKPIDLKTILKRFQIRTLGVMPNKRYL